MLSNKNITPEANPLLPLLSIMKEKWKEFKDQDKPESRLIHHLYFTNEGLRNYSIDSLKYFASQINFKN
jgi:hypothetical protein